MLPEIIGFKDQIKDRLCCRKGQNKDRLHGRRDRPQSRGIRDQGRGPAGLPAPGANGRQRTGWQEPLLKLRMAGGGPTQGILADERAGKVAQIYDLGEGLLPKVCQGAGGIQGLRSAFHKRSKDSKGAYVI